MRVFLLIATWSCLMACSANKETPKELAMEEVVFEYERTACFGTCPVYKLTVYHTGDAILVGKSNFDYIGTFKCQDCDREMIAKTLEIAHNVKFWDMKDVYDPGVTDLPSTIYKFNTRATPKQVIDVLDGPEELKELQSIIEDLYLKRKWVKIEKK